MNDTAYIIEAVPYEVKLTKNIFEVSTMPRMF